MTTEIRPIPTVYRGTRFRSRLEARWAAFFDLIRWSWVYEPFDAPGWIPDFLIDGNAPFLVEVGPCVSRDDYIAKAAKPLAFPDHPTLVLGTSPVVSWDRPPTAGMLANEFPGMLANAFWMTCPDGFSVFQDNVDLPCGHPYGGTHNHPWADDLATIEQLWRRAGNDVQWRGPEKVGDILLRSGLS